jgi:ATP-binding cassette subfamily B protein
LGQRQLLSFIRAILYNPSILILDEATSSVDTESEMLIQKAIDKLITERTSIVIAHRLSTIRKADKIIVLDKGEIKEMGTHEELLSLEGYYHKLYQLQFDKKTKVA